MRLLQGGRRDQIYPLMSQGDKILRLGLDFVNIQGEISEQNGVVVRYRCRRC